MGMVSIYIWASLWGNTRLSWLQPLGREPSEEPFCEQEEHDDFLGVGCHMFTPWSISSRATAHHHHKQIKPNEIPNKINMKVHLCKKKKTSKKMKIQQKNDCMSMQSPLIVFRIIMLNGHTGYIGKKGVKYCNLSLKGNQLERCTVILDVISDDASLD